MVLKPGLLPRSWLVSCIGFIDGVFVVSWVSAIQWKEHLTTAELAGRFGMIESIGDLLTQYRLRCLGHITRMSDTRQPKKLLFGWLPQKRPTHGAKLRGRDKVRQDLWKCGVGESS